MLHEFTNVSRIAYFSMEIALEHAVLPLCYDDRAGWIAVMKGAIGKNASVFNTHHMIRRYATEAYMF
jgi:hypothetical protein